MAVPLSLTATATDPVTGLSAAGSASSRTRPYVGCTTDPGDYPNATYLSAATTFNALTGTGAAYRYQKHYLTESQTLTGVPARISQLAPQGCYFGVCFKPSRTISAQAQANLQSNINILKSAGVRFDAILYQEMQPDFTSPAAYKAYCDAYAPIITGSGINLVYNAVGATMSTALSYWPGDQPAYQWYAITCDLYATGYFANGGGDYLNPLYSLAARNGKKFGVLEAGPTAGANPVPPSQAQYTQYSSYLASVMQGARFPYAVVYFNQDNKTGAVDTVQSSSDPWVPGIQALWASLN